MPAINLWVWEESGFLNHPKWCNYFFQVNSFMSEIQLQINTFKQKCAVLMAVFLYSRLQNRHFLGGGGRGPRLIALLKSKAVVSKETTDITVTRGMLWSDNVKYSLISIRQNYYFDMFSIIWHEIVCWFLKIYQDLRRFAAHSSQNCFCFEI